MITAIIYTILLLVAIAITAYFSYNKGKENALTLDEPLEGEDGLAESLGIEDSRGKEIYDLAWEKVVKTYKISDNLKELRKDKMVKELWNSPKLFTVSEKVFACMMFSALFELVDIDFEMGRELKAELIKALPPNKLMMMFEDALDSLHKQLQKKGGLPTGKMVINTKGMNKEQREEAIAHAVRDIMADEKDAHLMVVDGPVEKPKEEEKVEKTEDSLIKD